ncbi:MAG: hypothetical protein IH986_18925 [Planctomycetes bacterium]|nr:hypothetical protein [Planctomycetota bacterium]
MDPSEILKLLRAQPFEAFVIHLVDGRRFEVRHPELMLVTKRSLFLGWHSNGNEGPADDWVIFSPIAIATLEPMGSE